MFYAAGCPRSRKFNKCYNGISEKISKSRGKDYQDLSMDEFER